jgi:transcriptional regulator with XRE-family HTH domain
VLHVCDGEQDFHASSFEPQAAAVNRLADRVRSLLIAKGCGEDKTVEDCARDLEVSADALRDITDRQTRLPSIGVLEAIVRHYGVDPSWLITGSYSSVTHQEAGDDFNDSAALRVLLARLIDERWRNPDAIERAAGSKSNSDR